MGPTFVKIGQLLSSRADLLPDRYLKALSRLQDKVKPFSYAEVEEIVENELGVRISKAFAATGLRVGWTVAPPQITARMRDILGHVGAWAPRPEQVAVAHWLGDTAGIAAYQQAFKAGVEARLRALYAGLEAMAKDGLPVRAIPPRAAIYLTAQFDLLGLKTREGHVLSSSEDIRKFFRDLR